MKDLKFRAWDGVSFTYWGLGIYPGAFSGPASTMAGNPMSMTHQQFTGCKLKDGKEIYEGDILAIAHDIGDDDTITEVVFQNGAFVVEDEFGECDLMPIGWALECWEASGDVVVIIGNRFANPDLAKAVPK